MNFKSVMLTVSCLSSSIAIAVPSTLNLPNNFMKSLSGATQQITGFQSSYQSCVASQRAATVKLDTCKNSLASADATCQDSLTTSERQAVELIFSSVAGQQNATSNAWGALTGVTVAPVLVTALIGNITDSINITLESAAQTLGVTQTVRNSQYDVTIVGLMDGFKVTINHAIDHYIRTQWERATVPASASAFNQSISTYANSVAGLGDTYEFYASFIGHVRNGNFSNDTNIPLPIRGSLITFDQFVERLEGQLNTDSMFSLKSFISKAIEEWSVASHVSVNEEQIENFMSTLLGGELQPTTVVGALNAFSADKSNITLMNSPSTQDYGVSVDGAFNGFIDTYSKASHIYPYPEEISTYISNLQIAVTDANPVNLTYTPLAGTMAANITDQERLYLISNVTYGLSEAVQGQWASIYDSVSDDWPTFSQYLLDASTFYDGSVAAGVYFSSSFNTTLLSAVRYGVGTWANMTSASLDQKTYAIEKYDTAVMAVTQPDSISPVSLRDMTRSMLSSFTTLYAELAMLQHQLIETMALVSEAGISPSGGSDGGAGGTSGGGAGGGAGV